jgi:hypothetical protein
MVVTLRYERPQRSGGFVFVHGLLQVVVRAKLSVKILGAATHFILRQLLSNNGIASHVVLFKLVLRAYLDLAGEGEEEEAASILARDLCKEIAPRIRSTLAVEALTKVTIQLLPLQNTHPRQVYDAEVLFFTRHPHAIRAFAVSRSLLRERHVWDLGDAMKRCRQTPVLLLALIMTVLPRPLCLGMAIEVNFGITFNLTGTVEGPPKHSFEIVSDNDVNTMITVLLYNQAWLSLWEIDVWLLAQLAAVSSTFADALVTRIVAD